MPTDTMNTTPLAHNAFAVISVLNGEDRVCSHNLEAGSYVLIGSSDVCAMTIPDNQLSPIHCALRWEGEEFCVEDWHSDAGVTVNGERISNEHAVTADNDIRFGDYRLLIGDISTEVPEAQTPAVDSAPHVDTDCADATETAPNSPAVSEPESEIPVEAPPQTPVDRPAAPTPPLQRVSDLERAEGIDAETIELLRAEVEQLQYDLAERDLQLADLSCGTDEGDCGLEESDEDDTLLIRLEDLLSELERNDERCGVLEQLLQVSEDKHRAEQEERRHLTEWVNDIEERLGEREAEWRSERDALTHRVEMVLSERDELMQQLSEPRLSEAEGSAAQQENEQVRASNLELRQQLHDAEDRHARLEEELREKEKQLAARTSADSELRAQHLKLAQDRAAIARQQAEMTAQLAATSQLPPKAETEIDCKLREFRQHLREIHNEEEQNPRTVSSRLARIWAKLEGHG